MATILSWHQCVKAWQMFYYTWRANNWNLVKILSNQVPILHMPPQLSCGGMCKIQTGLHHHFLRRNFMYFHKIWLMSSQTTVRGAHMTYLRCLRLWQWPRALEMVLPAAEPPMWASDRKSRWRQLLQIFSRLRPELNPVGQNLSHKYLDKFGSSYNIIQWLSARLVSVDRALAMTILQSYTVSSNWWHQAIIWNNWNSYTFIQENAFENVVGKILSRPQCVHEYFYQDFEQSGVNVFIKYLQL